MKEKKYSGSRRRWFKSAGLVGLGAVGLPQVQSVPGFSENVVSSTESAQELQIGGPRVIEIGHEPQTFVDDYLVDNFWGIDFARETVTWAFHQPRRNPINPVIKKDGGFVSVVYDKEAAIFRMVYEDFWILSREPFKYTYAIAYAESSDGINWKLPRIGKYKFKGSMDNNIVLTGPVGGMAGCPYLLDLPEDQRRGYKYIMLYRTTPQGMYLIGSNDCINWDPASKFRMTTNYAPDTLNSIVWDPKSKMYTAYTRATNIYGGEEKGTQVVAEHGNRRKIAILQHDDLWSQWPIFPENILLPDAEDVGRGHWKFYGMPSQYYAGVYFGFLWPYSKITEKVYTELVTSRDGRNFKRFPGRPSLIDLGVDGSWDHGMIFASPNWLEVGDEWWIYYMGSNENHASKNNTYGIGLMRVRKEGFISLRSPAGGGKIVTRLMRWPGGKLFINADAGTDGLTVKVTGFDRKPVNGFDSEPSISVTGDSVRHEVKWKNGDMHTLKGKDIRLEFFLKSSGDIYSFRAAMPGEEG
jgi:hypothetical protein